MRPVSAQLHSVDSSFSTSSSTVSTCQLLRGFPKTQKKKRYKNGLLKSLWNSISYATNNQHNLTEFKSLLKSSRQTFNLSD